LTQHSLLTTLKSLSGNPRGCVYTEPLWGIPFNLYAPYVSLYMASFGVSDSQIGLIASVSWGFQILTALLSGVLTDKFGRRRTTLFFDVLAWTVPAVISALAANVWYFLAAGILNSFWRIPMNSWTCLLVEDADREQLVDIYTWIYIANQLVGFAAPLAGALVAAFSLVPTVRGLYVFAALMFTLKFVLTYKMTEETAQGKIRMRETQGESVLGMLRGYAVAVRALLRTPQTLYVAGVTLVLSIATLIRGSFWSLLLTEKLHIPAQHVAAFPFVRSAVILAFFFVVMPRIAKVHSALPVVIGFGGFLASQLLLIAAPERGYGVLIASVVLEACSFAAVSPLVDQLLALTIDPMDRARIQSILSVGVIVFTAPFGWIAGVLSERSKDLPFILTIALFALGAALAYMAGRSQRPQPGVEAAAS
jgi:MFS family permease